MSRDLGFAAVAQPEQTKFDQRQSLELGVVDQDAQAEMRLPSSEGNLTGTTES